MGVIDCRPVILSDVGGVATKDYYPVTRECYTAKPPNITKT